MKQQLAFVIFAGLLLLATSASAQYYGQESHQFDVGFGVGTVVAPSSSSASDNYSPQTIGSGTYLGFSGDYLFWRHVGVQAEVNWRASQNTYFGYQPFRPIFYDFNAIYAPPLGKHAQLELLGGLGGLSTRFYTPFYNCNYVGYNCTNYFSSNHFMGDVGIAVRFYVHNGLFLRPEFRQYFIHNNYEFSSGFASRAGVTLGYSFGR